MLIILEGADGVGKSTLAANLAETLSAELLHFGPPEDHPLAEYQLPLDGYRPGGAGGRHVVIDRLHWSQEVYGPLHRGECLLGREGMLHMDLYLRSRGALMVHLTDWPARVAERMTSRGDQGLGDPPPEDLRHLIAAYWHLAQSSQVPTLTYRFGETDRDNPDGSLFGQIVCAAAELGELAAPLGAFPSYVGQATPQVLLLGDRREGANARSARHEAAFAPYPACSGAYLLRALPTSLHAVVGVANACEVDVAALWETLERPTVVALGKAALEATEAAGVPCGAVPHPQYWRRFHHWKPELYGGLIDAASLTSQRTLSWPNEREPLEEVTV